MKTKLVIGVGVAVVAIGAVGCEVTSEKIQTWKQSIKGAAKIRAALRDSGQKLPVRVEAAVALGELGLFTPLVDDLKSLGPDDRKKLMGSLTSSLVSKMEGNNPQASNKVQLQAKDALFSIREIADASMKQTIDQKVVNWLVGDWRTRTDGEHSCEKIVTTIGEPAGSVLAETIGKGGTPLIVSATMLRKIASQADRDLAAENLVALAAKEAPAKESTFHALGKVGSLKATAYLLKVADKGGFEERLWAIRALALYPHPSSIKPMYEIAKDTSLVDEQAILRDEAFTVLEKTDDPKSLELLVSFLASSEEKVRYRAVEAIVSGFKAGGLTKLLEGLPSRYTYAKKDLEDYIEQDIIGLGSSAAPALRTALKSESWIARLVAVRVLGKVGTTQDIENLKKLENDRTRIKGWEGGATIGSEALAAAKRINKQK